MEQIEAKFQAGAVQATIFNNPGREDTIFQTISIVRRYNKDGEWKSSSSFRVMDLPKVALVAGKAYEYLVLKSGTPGFRDASEEKEPIADKVLVEDTEEVQ